MRELYKRIFSGIIGIILLIFIILKGRYYLSIFICILSLVGLREFYGALKNMGANPVEYIGYLASLGVFISNLNSKISIDFIFTISLIYLFLLMTFKKSISLKDISFTVLSIMYIPFLFNYIFYLDKTKFIWLIFIIPFSTDTFAYFTGNLIGKNKLSPKISPNKTVEGSVGGILGGLLSTIIYSLYMQITPLWKMIILSILISIFAQIGDLVASQIKRKAKIKDYGFIMPGHGGILDRFDSVIFSSPLIYYYIKYFLN